MVIYPINELKCIIRKNLRNLEKDEDTMRRLTDRRNRKPIFKNANISIEARKEGNEILLREQISSFATYHKILRLYNKSIAFAPTGSEELATAHANKSAVLRRMRKYVECVSEVDMALKLTISNCLKVKLLCRKAECLTALGSPENISCLERAKFILSKSEVLDDIGEKLHDLLTKTQEFVTQGKLEMPKENKRKIQSQKMVAAAEKSNMWNRIKIEYSPAWGPHLVATQDFESGEIVLVEKVYRNNLDDTKMYLHCHHCFNYLWTVAPCEHCSDHLYCTEKCRDEACSSYHDLECTVVARIKETVGFIEHPLIPYCVSIFFKTLKEAGSFSQLQAQVEAIDKCKDRISKHLLPSEKPANYKTVYSMPAREVKGFEWDQVLKGSTLALIGLAKHSKIFGSTFDLEDLKNLANNDVAVFVGALLLKIGLIANSKCSCVNFRDPDLTREFKLDEMTNDCNDCTSNYFLKLRTLLSTHACVPNVFVCLGYENKSIMFSIRPIKAGDKLCTSMLSVYDKTPDEERRGMFKIFYNRSCLCQACKGNWMDQMFDGPRPMKLVSNKIPKSEEIYNEIRSIEAEMQANFHKATHPDMKVVTRTKNLSQLAWKRLRMPSPLLILAGKLMIEVFKELHSLSEVYPDVSDFCKPQGGHRCG